MRKTLTTVCTVLTTLVIGALPGAAGTVEDAEITDPAGDANFVSVASGNQQDTRPASFDNADLRAVWFETEYSTAKILDPETGAIRRVEHRPVALVIKFATQAPVRPLTPWGALRFKVLATTPACQATFEVLVATNPAFDSAEIRPAAPSTSCGEVSIVKSPVMPTYDGAVSTITFPLAHEQVSQVISAGTVLSQTSALVIASPPAGSPIPSPSDQTASGRNFTVGQDLPPDVDCTADPGNPECQP